MTKGLLTLTGILLLANPAFAVPPSSIEADYVKEEGKLYVYMSHVSRDHINHYIRKTEIMINGEEVAVENNRQQIDPNSYGFSLALHPKENDEITVKAFCSEGGSKSVSLVIPQEKDGKDAAEKTKKESEVKAKVLAYKSFRADVGIYGSKVDVYGNKSEIFDSKADPMKSKAGVYGSKKATMSDQTEVYGSKKSAVEGEDSGY